MEWNLQGFPDWRPSTVPRGCGTYYCRICSTSYSTEKKKTKSVETRYKVCIYQYVCFDVCFWELYIHSIHRARKGYLELTWYTGWVIFRRLSFHVRGEHMCRVGQKAIVSGRANLYSQSTTFNHASQPQTHLHLAHDQWKWRWNSATTYITALSFRQPRSENLTNRYKLTITMIDVWHVWARATRLSFPHPERCILAPAILMCQERNFPCDQSSRTVQSIQIFRHCFRPENIAVFHK